MVRREWPRVERPLWAALEHGAVDPEAAVRRRGRRAARGLRARPVHPPSRGGRAARGAAVGGGRRASRGDRAAGRLRARPGRRRGGRRRGRGRAAAPRPAAAGLPSLRGLRGAPGRLGGGGGRVEAAGGRAAGAAAAVPRRRAGDRGRADRGLLARQARRRRAPQPPGGGVGGAGVLDAPGAEASRLVAGEHSYRLSLRAGRQRRRPRVRARRRGGAERAGGRPAGARCSRPPTCGAASRCPRSATPTGRFPGASA